MPSIRLLLVEDSLDHIELTRQFLELQGEYELDAVTRVADFWNQVEAGDYDVILLDHNLPDGDGLEILKGLAARGVKTPTVVITGYGDERVAARSVLAGAADYVVKTGHYLQTLPEVIARVMEQGGLRRALEEAEARYRDLFEQAGDGILVCDAEGVIQDANPMLCRWLDVSREALVGQRLEAVEVGDRPGAGADRLEQLARDGLSVYEANYRRRDGTAFPVEVSGRWVPARGRDRPASIQFLVRDITRRKEMEAEIIRRTRALAAVSEVSAAISRSLDLQQVLAAALDGMTTALEIDCAAIYLDANYSQALGDGRDAAGMYLAAVRGFSAGFTERMGCLGAEQRAGLRLPSLDRRQEWAVREGVRACLAHPLTVKGQAVGLLLLAARTREAFTADEVELVRVNCDRITLAVENARLFQSLQQSVEALRAAQSQLIRVARLSAVGELAAGVAHQINNPLTTVIADAQLLLKSIGPDHPGYASAAAIFQAGWRAQRVVQRLLNFSRPDEGQYVPTDVNATVVEALDLVSAHLERGGVDLRVSLAPDLPLIPANAHQLEEIWINLLMNARDALANGRPGAIGLTSRLAASEAMVEVEVTDNGRGISRDDQAHLFTPFFTTKGPGHGNGLGLSVCQSIVQDHQGEIAFQTQPGQGTTFVVRLPRSRAPSAGSGK